MNTRRVTRRSSTNVQRKNYLPVANGKRTQLKPTANKLKQMGVKRARSNSELNVKPEQKRRAVFGDLTNNSKVVVYSHCKNKPVPSGCSVTSKTESNCTLTRKASSQKPIEPIVEEPSIVQLSLALEPVTITADNTESPYSSLPEETDFDAFDKEHTGVAIWETEYAKDVFDYYRRQESTFAVPEYMSEKQTDITAEMRSILVEWMVEVQSNFELYHETLYLAVKLVDKYLSKTNIRRSVLQLVGTAALFLACKYEEHALPQCDDFLFVCDNAYDTESLFEMERSLLQALDFCLGIPLSYRFLRRYSNVSGQNLRTLTLARYILETSLLDYQFCYEKESLKAAASLFIALRMTNESWDPILAHHSGYQESDLIDLAVRLNGMLLDPPVNSNNEVHKKYSHNVFLQVAQIPKLSTDALKCE